MDRDKQCESARAALNAFRLGEVNVTVGVNFDGPAVYTLWLRTGHHTAGPMRGIATQIAENAKVPLGLTYALGPRHELSFTALLLPNPATGELSQLEIHEAARALKKACSDLEKVIIHQAQSSFQNALC